MAGDKNWCTDGVLGKLIEIIDLGHADATVRMIAVGRQITTKKAQKCLDILRRRGLAERVATGIYRVTKKGRAAHAAGAAVRSGPCRPHTGPRRRCPDSLQVRLWRALRQEKKATIAGLIALAARGDERDPESNARHYLRTLVAAGYVRVLPRREPGTAPTSPGFKRFLLVRDTGPAAPIWNNGDKTLRDPNTGDFFEVHFGQDRPAAQAGDRA